ncbi:MAG: hypothetical protein ACP5PZ_10215 [Bacteroidales bacterium]
MQRYFLSSIAFFLLHSLLSSSQTTGWFNEHPAISCPADTLAGQLILNISTSNFVKDNEYFNQMVEGYTLIGFWAEPTLKYNISKQTNICAGLSAVRFFGKSGFYAHEPIMSVEHWFSQRVSLTMGSLPCYQRGLPPPLLDPERYYLKRVDNGALLRVIGSAFSSETWLSWDRFSFYGDSTQEHISAGSSSLLAVLKGESFKIQLPLYLVITHKGGQVLRPKQPIETLVNAGSGLRLVWIHERFSVEINPNGFIYRKLSSHPSQPFTFGWALYPVFHLSYGNLTWESSWWHGQKFIAPRGEPIYSQISTVQPNYFENIRNVATNKIAYHSSLAKGLQLETALEGYYFPSEKRMDYNFWLHFNWNFRHSLLRVTPD